MFKPIKKLFKQDKDKMQSNPVYEVLDKVFIDLNREEKSNLAAEFKEKTYQSGQYLCKKGDDGDFFFIIKSGRIQVLNEKDGKEFAAAELKEGDFAGEQALRFGKKRNASLKAIQDTITYYCTKKTFGEIAKRVKFAKREPKRNAFVTNINYDDMKGIDDEKQDKLDDDTIDQIYENVKENDLFVNLNIDQAKQVLQYMKLINVKCGQFVINQGINTQIRNISYHI